MQKLLATLLLTLSFASLASAQQQSALKLPHGTLGPVIEYEDDARLKLSTDNIQYSGIEPVQLTVALKNTGKKTFNILPMDVEWFYKIEVTGPDGKILPYKKPRRSIYRALSGTSPLFQMVREEPVRSGEIKKAIVWLSNLFDMSTTGRYKVNVSTTFLRGTGGDTIEIRAEPINIEVTSTPPISEWLATEKSENDMKSQPIK